MENASKALLMAAGVLLVMLIIALIMFGMRTVSNYYKAQDEIAFNENVAKFNAQFEVYNRDNVSGYELVSLANNVADYNTRYSNAEGARNDEGYKPIDITITFKNDYDRNSLSYDENPAKLFTSNIMSTNANTNNTSRTKNFIQVLNEANGIEAMYGDSNDGATKVAKNLGNIEKTRAADNYYGKSFNTLTTLEKKALEERCVKNFNIASGESATTYAEVETYIGSNQGEKMKKYWEYYQFKRGIFKAKGIQYDNEASGRVISLSFEFTGKIE